MALTAATKTELYQFFAIAFDAAPGVTYMSQLADAANAGMSVEQIVEVFTTKPQFTAVYPNFMTNEQFAAALVHNVVGDSASDAAQAEAIADIEGALSAGWSRGKVIYQIFSNLAEKMDDPVWGGTAKLLANQVAVAQYATETQHFDSTNLPKLQAILDGVTSSSDVSTPAAIEAIIAGATGQNFVLTEDVDHFTGGTGNDTFKVWDGVGLGGSDLTLAKTVAGADDVINGGAGTDTLNWFATLDHNNELVGSFSNIENVNITGADNIGGRGAEVAVAEANVESASQAAYNATYDVYEGVYDVLNELDSNRDWANVEWGTASDIVSWSEDALDAFDRTDADTVVFQAAVDAAGAASSTPDSVYSAALAAAQPYFEAYYSTYEALYAAEDALNDAEAMDIVIDAAFFGGMTKLTHDGAVVDTINLASNQTLVLTAPEIFGDVQLKDGATTANIVFQGTLHADDFDVWNDDGALQTVNVTSDSIKTLSLWTNSASQVNIDIDTDGVVDLELASVDADAAAVIDASASTADLHISTDQEDIASITTGTGDDIVHWEVEGVPNDLTIVTGAGSDTVVFHQVLPQDGTLTVDLGTENDTFDASDMLLTDFAPEVTKVDGGAGIDTLKVLMEGFQTEESYIRLNEDFTNFETLVLTQNDDVSDEYSDELAPVQIDASKLANFTRFELTGYNDYDGEYGPTEGPLVFTNVLSTQTVSTQFDWYDGSGGGAINLTAQGYGVAGADVADIHAEHITPVGGGFTHTEWEMYGDNATLDVSNNSVEDAMQGAEVELYGDVTTLTLNIDGGFTSDTGGWNGYANVGFDAYNGQMENLTSVTVNGQGASYVWIDNYEGAALANIDASGMDATGLSSDAGWDYDFYYYTENASVAESIQLGDAVDYIEIGSFTDGDGNTAFGSNRGHMDTITGFDFANDTVYADETFTLVAEADLVGSTLATVLQNLATDTVVDSFVFQYKGDTYLFTDVEQGVTADTLSTNDLLVKIVGTDDMEAAGYAGTWVDWTTAV